MNGLLRLSYFILLWGCVPDPGPLFVPLNIDVFNEMRRPVADVSVSLDGQVWHTTDETGHLQMRLSGPEGRVVKVSIQCPHGTVAENGITRDLLVRFLRPIGGGDNVPLHARFSCVSPIRKSVLLVRADSQMNLPVHALGRQVAVTDENGIAEVVLEGVPGEEIEVLLNTSEHPDLRPSMPSRRLVLPTSRQIFIFDQKFKTQKARRKRKRQRRYLGPRRI